MAQIALSADTVDDLIYSARSGDVTALKEDLSTLSAQHSCREGTIVASAIDGAPEAEGGTGACLLHYPAANGNIGMFPPDRGVDVIAKGLTGYRNPNASPPELAVGGGEDGH